MVGIVQCTSRWAATIDVVVVVVLTFDAGGAAIVELIDLFVFFSLLFPAHLSKSEPGGSPCQFSNHCEEEPPFSSACRRHSCFGENIAARKESMMSNDIGNGRWVDKGVSLTDKGGGEVRQEYSIMWRVS